MHSFRVPINSLKKWILVRSGDVKISMGLKIRHKKTINIIPFNHNHIAKII